MQQSNYAFCPCFCYLSWNSCCRHAATVPRHCAIAIALAWLPVLLHCCWFIFACLYHPCCCWLHPTHTKPVFTLNTMACDDNNKRMNLQGRAASMSSHLHGHHHQSCVGLMHSYFWTHRVYVNASIKFYLAFTTCHLQIGTWCLPPLTQMTMTNHSLYFLYQSLRVSAIIQCKWVLLVPTMNVQYLVPGSSY